MRLTDLDRILADNDDIYISPAERGLADLS